MASPVDDAAAGSARQQWTIILVVTALILSLVVLVQQLASHASAYLAAPGELAALLDAADFAIDENESYDRDVARVSRLEDKMRLGRILREIQKGGDDLREDLNRVLVSEEGTTLRTAARLLWASRRRAFEERIRRLDLLRMRFLVVYMGLIAAQAEKQGGGTGSGGGSAHAPTPRDPEKAAMMVREDLETPTKPMLPRSLTESITGRKHPPLRRLTTQAIGHNANVAGDHRKGWAGVVQELQRSPRMHQRHASIEMAMARPSKTP